MATYIDTIASAEDKGDLKDTLIEAAALLKKQGMGKSHYVSLEYRRGVWMVLLYER